MTGETVETADTVGRLLEPVLASMGYELVDTELCFEGRKVLRVYIDTPGGVTLDDCTEATHRISDILDVEDPVSGAYVLEVSSPGIERPLRKPRDFERFAGEAAKIITFRKLGGRRNFKGVLRGLEGTEVNLEVGGELVRIPLDEIRKARLDMDPFAAKDAAPDRQRGARWTST